MQGKQGLVVLFCGLAAATGAGVWVLQGGQNAPGVTEQARTTPRTIAQDTASQQPEPVAPQFDPVERPAWTPPTQPIIIAEPEEEPEADREQSREDRRERFRRQMLEQYDTDGDGELSEAERDAARRQWEERAQAGRELMLRRFDTDGDGELNEAERDAARSEFRRVRDEIADRIIPEYDLDGDGELNPQEREAAGPAFRAEFQRLRITAQLDLDGSGSVDQTELARAVLAVTDGDEAMDLNRDGKVDYEDAAYAAEIAQSND